MKTALLFTVNDTERSRRFRLFALLLVYLVCFAFCCKAQYMVTFTAVDSITRLTLPECEILAFLPGDSVVVEEGRYLSNQRQGEVNPQKQGTIMLPEKEVEYHIMIDAEGYNTRVLPVILPATQERFTGLYLGEVGIQRTPKQLKEVTVEATKIRMYYKGDTLVYNADAFLLPDGSMLDDLIRKLDGVHIDRNGVIWCKGRRVSSLQLEGRQLFDGNPRVLLENLGAYTVNKIKVYEQSSLREQFLGYSEKQSEEKPLVMDVILKKEYAIGKWVNIDAGYGTSNRYLGRAFMLGFTKTWALSAFFNANNLSGRSDPGQYTSWKMDDTGTDESSYLSGGISYQHDWGQGVQKSQIRGSVEVRSSDITYRSSSERINYLSTGDTYETKYYSGKKKSFKVNTSHTLNITPSKVVTFSVSPRFNYSKDSSFGSSVGATLDRYISELSANDIEFTYSGDESSILKYLINRSIRREKENQNYLGAGLSASSTIKLPTPANSRYNHNLTLEALGNYQRMRENSFDQYLINLGSNPTPADNIYAYTSRTPSVDANVKASASYALNVKGQFTSSLKYQYEHTCNENKLSRYLLNELTGEEAGDIEFGQLPTNVNLMVDVLDLQNSYNSRAWSYEHSILLNTYGRIGQSDFDKGGHGGIVYSINPSLRINERNLNYTKHEYDTLAIRHSVLPAINGYINFIAEQSKKEYNYTLGLRWNSTPSYLSMTNLINVTDNTNPLYITRGNPNLRNAYSHTGAVDLTFHNSGKIKRTHSVKYEYNFITDAITSGTVYNPETGIRTSSKYNVDGNRTQTITIQSEGPIAQWNGGRTARITYNLTIKGDERRRVDMFSSNDVFSKPLQTFVYNRSLSPNAKISLHMNNFAHNITLSFNGNWRRYTGEAEYYTPFSSADLIYTLSGSFTLPKNIVLSTNFNVNTRSGYNDPNLNKTEYIWNASASWNWKNTGLTFTLDGYDLLHQRSNIRYYADNMGRTEVWNNTISSYVLFRIRYHLNLTKK